MTCYPTSLAARALAACIATLAIALAIPGQCQLNWQPGTPKPGPSGLVTCVTSLSNGDLVVGGWFDRVGNSPANRVARWDGSQWHTLAGGLNGDLHELTVMPNGDIVVCGDFTQAGGLTANRIARWDGTSWSPIGAGFNGTVHTVRALPNGNLLAGGLFTASGATTLNKVAIWDGTNWSGLGGGLFGTGVLCSEVMPNGDIVVGGPFGLGSGTANVARWDGASWSTFPFGFVPQVNALAVAPNGDLAIGGLFGSGSVGIWDGTNLQVVPLGLPSDLHYAPTGELFAANGTALVEKWDGATATSMPNANAVVEVLHTLPSGQLLAGGGLSTSQSALCRPLHVWNGSSWDTMQVEPDFRQHLTTGANGELFSVVSNIMETEFVVERWNGSSWQTLTTPLQGNVTELTPDGSGGAFVVGNFTLTSAWPYPYIAHWDGTTWTAANLTAPGYPRDLFTARDGSVYVASRQYNNAYALRFDAGQWQSIGPMLYGELFSLTEMSNGDPVVGGQSILSLFGPESCARWDGTAWIDMGLVGTVDEIEAGRDGTLIVRGTDLLIGVPQSNLVFWDGSSWTVVPTGATDDIRSIVVLPNDDLLAAGSFATIAGTPANNIARWDGSTWQAIGTGANGEVNSVAITRAGEVFVTGTFLSAGGQPSAGTAHAESSCAATVTSFGSGCVGPAGPISIAASTLPWAGSDYRSRVYGMPGNSVGVHAIGTATGSLPLATILPQSLPGCALLVSPIILELVVPSATLVEAVMRLPNNPALIGATLHHQVLPVQFSASGSIAAIAASNGLSATVGFF